MFRLLRYFSLTSLVLVVLAALALGALYRHVTTANLLQMGERNNVALTVALANALRAEIDSVLAGSSVADASQRKQDLEQLNALVMRQTRGLSVVKVKIYDTRGKTVYSSEAKQIGEDKSGNRGFQLALAGQAASELTHRDKFSAFEQQIANRDLLASYVPVRRADGAQVQAVFEIYDDITPLLAQVAVAERQIMGGVTLVLVVLYAVLFLLVRHADAILRRQHASQALHESELQAARDELELRVSERTLDLERANRAKSQFLANMSHEVRTPMNAVLGLSELLAASGLSGEQLRHAQSIHSSAQSLLGVLNDILDVTRIEAGHLDLIKRRFEPRQMLAQVRAMLLPLAEAKGLALEAQVDAAVPAAVVGDEGRLRQILVNLVANAIKFTERGRVDIGLRLDAAASGQIAPAQASAGEITLQMQVRDTGIGIAPDKLATLFERFVQIDDTDTRRHGGTGLGLYIVRELAARMGGSATVQSLPGVGSSFDVSVCLNRMPLGEGAVSPGEGAAPAATMSGALPPKRPGRPLAVLLVEDNDINRMVARAMLESVGHRVTEAVDGAHAVASHAAQPFDCILMDAQMPVMDGIEATRRIRAREAAEGSWRTPIVALTANAMQGDSERYLAAGMDAFLSKPYESAALLEIISSVCKPLGDKGRLNTIV